MTAPARHDVPTGLRVVAAYAWRILVVAAVIGLVGIVVGRLRLLILPLFVALLATATLAPSVRRLAKLGTPRWLAVLVTMLGSLAVIGGVIALLAPQVKGEFDALDISVRGGVDEVRDWLVTGPLGLSESRVDELIDRTESQLRDNAGSIAGGALSGAMVALELVAGALLALVLTFFLLKDGPRLWPFVVSLFPKRMRADLAGMGERAWITLGGFIRGTAIVAVVDAMFIGLALYLLDVPLVVPLAVLTFAGGFIPIVGAFVAGFAAAMVALVSNGLVTALLVVAASVAVQQIEGNVMHPFIVARTVNIHPIMSLLAVTGGGILWGIPGAFVAVPVVAAIWAAIAYLRERTPEDQEADAARAVEEGRVRAGVEAGAETSGDHPISPRT